MIRKTLAVVSLTIGAAASAQSPDTTNLGLVVISASKAPTSRTSITQPVTVISGEELRAKGITRVSDALRTVPGAILVQNGSVGSVNTLFLRGGESRYTKVLIDGVAVNAPGGFFDFSHLTTDNIERIEIVRGAGSVVSGADAVAGIIQIFTRQGRGAFNMVADGRAGNYGSRELSLDANGTGGPLRYSLGGGARRTDGMISFNNNYYNGTLSASAGLTPREGSDLLLTARYTNAEFHYPTDFTGAPVDSNAYRVQHRLTVGIDAKTTLSETLSGRVQAGTNEVSDLTEDIINGFTTSGPPPLVHTAQLSRNKRRNVDASIAFKLPESSTLTIGAEYMAESERSRDSEGAVGAPATPTTRFDASRDNKAVYAELGGTSKTGSSLLLSARRDDNSDFDAANTWRAGVSVPAGASSRLRASIGTSYNAPAFNQIRETLFTVASPDLKPEKGRTWQVGLEQTLVYGILKISATYFNQRFTDLIQFVPGGPPDFLGSYANLTEAQSNGWEGEVTLTPVSNWSANASYTFAEPRVTEISSDYSGDLERGDALIRRPKHSGTGSIAWNRARETGLSVIASYIGDRPDLDFTQFPSPLVTLPAYYKVDVAGHQRLLRSGSGKSLISLTFRVDNVLDRKYEDVFNFPAPRRTWLIGARIEGAM
ncbi:MAG TPA: TonB-dependent receptor [Gemmatimonadaceae bacterium]